MIIKTEITKVFEDGGTKEDQLDAIKEIVLNPNKKIRRDVASMFTAASKILGQMMDDYQFDKLSPDYMGMLSSSGNDGHDPDTFRFLVYNISLFKDFIRMNGFEIEKASFEEFIIVLIHGEK